MVRKSFAAVLASGLLATALSASPSARADEVDSQVWAQFVYNARFPNKVRTFVEFQPRIGENYDRRSQFIFRPAVGYQVTPRMSLWLGYGYTPSFIPRYTGENRIFQQLLIEDHFPGFDLTNRTRLEERVIERAGDTSLRVRHQVRFSKPIVPSKRWAIVASNELFWNLNSTPRGPQAGFDQNRAYAGFAYNVTPKMRVELGYLASFVNPPRHQPNRRLDVLQMIVNVNR